MMRKLDERIYKAEAARDQAQKAIQDEYEAARAELNNRKDMLYEQGLSRSEQMMELEQEIHQLEDHRMEQLTRVSDEYQAERAAITKAKEELYK